MASLKLRSERQIQEFLMRPEHQLTIQTAIAPFHSAETTTRELRAHQVNVNRLVLQAALGEKVFHGLHGRALLAAAENRHGYRISSKRLEEVAKVLAHAGAKVHRATLAIPEEKLPGNTSKLRGKFAQIIRVQAAGLYADGYGRTVHGIWNWWEKHLAGI
ncbi:MAG: hypothetical protein V1722_05760 [Candidatus Micrarchaeota archaeon]